VVEARIRIGWNKFRQLVPLLTNKDVSLIMRGRLYSSCLRSSMLHGSETWPVRKENVVALQQTEMRMVRWMCGVKLKDRLPSKELKERLGTDDIDGICCEKKINRYSYGPSLRLRMCEPHCLSLGATSSQQLAYVQIWRHPQYWKCVTYYYATRAGPRHGHR